MFFLLISVLKWYEDLKLAVALKNHKPTEEELEFIKKFYGDYSKNFVYITDLDTYLEQLEMYIVNEKPELLTEYMENEAKYLHNLINKGHISIMRTPNGFVVVDFKHKEFFKPRS